MTIALAEFLFDPAWPQPQHLYLAPDAIVVQTGLSGAVATVADDPDAPDASWMTGTNGVASELRVSFPTPSGPVLTNFPQKFRVRVRPTP